MVVVFAIPRSVRWVGQVIASRDQLKNLEPEIVINRSIHGDVGTGLTTHVTLSPARHITT